MTINLTIFLLLVIIVFLALIIHTILKNRLSLKYSLLWLFAICLMLIMVLFPKILRNICNLLGIELVSNLVFLLGFLILLVITFALTIIVSEQKRKIVLLVQEIALIKKELNKK